MKSGRLLYQSALIAVLGVAVLGSTLAIARRDYSFFDPLVDVRSLIAQRYVADPDEAAMQRGAIQGMVDTLGDPHTVYIAPENVEEFNKGMTGDFVGIGVQVTTRDGWLTIVTPLEDTPAFRAGIMADDRIVEIEGESTFGLSTEQCVARLAGAEGEPVDFVIERGGKRIPITIVRERIITRTIKGLQYRSGDNGEPGQWDHLLDPDRRIAYVRLTQFTPGTADELRRTLVALGAGHERSDHADPLGGLVLDLRFNPGGVLQEAEAIVNLFLREGVIVSTRGRAHPDTVLRAREQGTLADFPMIVIVNHGSASASEIVAGALGEAGRAIVLGMRSFGKGSVQTVHSLPSGRGKLKLTEQRYYLASGRLIDRRDDATEWGVDPTDGYYVPMSEDQVAAMLDIRRRQSIIRSLPEEADPAIANDAPAWSDPAWIAEHLEDPQLAAAAEALQARIDAGDWRPTGEPLPAGAAMVAEDLQRAIQLRERMMRELNRLDQRIEMLQQATEEEGDPEARIETQTRWVVTI